MDNREPGLYKTGTTEYQKIMTNNWMEFDATWNSLLKVNMIRYNKKGVLFSIDDLAGDLVLSKDITSIMPNGFAGKDRLTSITFQEELEFIGVSAFKGCCKLQTINYNGTREEWDNLYKSFSSIPENTQIICAN